MTKLILPKSTVASDEPEHIKRLKQIARWRLPAEGTSDWVAFRLQAAAAERNPAYRKYMKESSRASHATHYAMERNGAGLPADSGVREFLSEYNRRTANFGLHYLPASFNIFEAFSEYLPKYGVFVPLKERDHLLSVRRFMDYQASLIDESYAYSVSEIEGGVIFNYSFVEDPGEWVFEEGGQRFVVCTASLVRHGTELSVMCLGGLQEDLRAATSEIEESHSNVRRDPAKPLLVEDENLRREAVALDARGKFHRLFFGFRVDLEKQRMQTRYILFDDGRSWGIKTDDPVTLDYIDRISNADEDKSAWTRYIEERGGIFSFLLRLAALPKFFSSQAESVVLDKTITSIADETQSSSKSRRIFGKALRNQVVYERKVSTLLGSVGDSSAVTLPGLELSVEVDGYWEKLLVGEYGVDRDGERILGRTWVRRTLSKRQATTPRSTVTGALEHPSSLSISDDAGYIYVLRNAAHQHDIFKIGLTRRDVAIRASELSRGTGIPDVFLIVQKWLVPDVVYAEKRIHQLLSAHRLKDSREFFKADYPVIRSAVDVVVSELLGRCVA